MKHMQESFTVSRSDAKPTLVKKAIAEIEGRIQDANLDILSRKMMKDALQDELDFIGSRSGSSGDTSFLGQKPTLLREGIRKLITLNHTAILRLDKKGRKSALVECDTLVRDRNEIIDLLHSYLTARYEQALALKSSSLQVWRRALLICKDIGFSADKYDRLIAIADDATLQLEADLSVGTPEHDSTIEDKVDALTQKFQKSRSDKGKKHHSTRQTSEWGMTQASVARDFNKSKFVPEKGAQPLGGCTVNKIKEWDREYPTAEHPNKYGYHAELRLKAAYKTEYYEVLHRWATYWCDYHCAFNAWRKKHKFSKRSSFRFTPLKTTTAIDLGRIGVDDNGEIFISPKNKDKDEDKDKSPTFF